MDVKFGACEFALPGNLVGTLKFAKDVGLEGLELGFFSQQGRGIILAQEWYRDYYLEEADRYNIKLLSLAVCEFDIYGLKYPKTTEKGKKVWEIIDQSISAAAQMNMEMIMMPSFNDGFIENGEELAITAEALIYACKEAAKHDIVITTENLLTVEDNLKLFKLVDKPNFSCLYDSQNYWIFRGWKQTPMLQALVDNNILYPEIHVKDGVGKAPSSAMLGEGDSDFTGTMEILKKINYSGWLHLENFHDRAPLMFRHNNYIDTVKEDLEILKAACE